MNSDLDTCFLVASVDYPKTSQAPLSLLPFALVNKTLYFKADHYVQEGFHQKFITSDKLDT